MFKIVTITQQGQISIPANFWKKLGLSAGKTADIRVQDDKMIIEPLVDLIGHAGIRASKRLARKSSDEISSIEERAVEDGFSQRSSGVVDYTAGAFRGDREALTAEEERAAVEKAIAEEAMNRSDS